MVVVQEFLQFSKPLGHRIEHAVVRIEHGFLAYIADARGGLAPYQPVIERCLACQHAHHAGFSAAVASDESYAFALVELKVSMVEQGYVTEGKAGFVQ